MIRRSRASGAGSPELAARAVRTLALAVAWAGLVATPAAAQDERPRGGANLGFDPSGYQQFNTDYSGNFTFVRLMYATDPWRAYRNPGWAHDYPVAERNFGKIMTELTTMTPWLGGSNVLAMDDPELFRYPVAYLSEPGDWRMSPEEAESLRNYLLKGGFMILDDLAGPRQWQNTVYMIEYMLPDHRLVELPMTHEIFDSFFHLEEENVRMPHPYRGGVASYWGVFEDNDPDGRLMMIVNRDNDIGDYMEWSDRGFVPIALSNEAYKLGVNYVVYALTH